MPSKRNLVAGAAIGGLLVIGGTTFAFADSATSTTTPSVSASASAKAGSPHSHTAVTGTELARVKAALTAKYPGVTIDQVQKDPDGSYDVMAKKSGSKVMYEVSKDLKTVTENQGGRGGHGGPGGKSSQDKVITGTVADQVKAAVKAKESSVTIDTVRQDPDGSYDALGTKSDGTKVFYDVSKDLKTVTLQAAPAGGAKGGVRG